ncbi:hypothetical protein ACIQNG_13400 [Streptomyces sp. NPDC091377]|uniref:hypothetical protein n=1 Tax=Streptomyces sp. NPDC091377 TaxID=3365995 RepID=UPI003812F00A
MDVDEVVRELYGLRPSEFVAARDAYVARAREAKDTAAAKAVAALRRPVLVAWAANQLARQRPDETERFLALAATLREAHRALDREQLRTAAREQHRLVAALTRTAADLAQEGGQPVGDPVLREVEQTLHAVLARPDVAELWSEGRLTKVPDPAVGFADVTPEDAAPPARPSPTAPKKPAGREKAQRREAEHREVERREVERARVVAREAAARVRSRERELASAHDDRTAVAGRVREAVERVRRLERELARARQDRSAAETAAATADRAVRAAEHALAEARRAAARADRGAPPRTDR